MNIAIINQGGNRYLFEVPESISLKEGEKVKCDTKRGITDGTVWADSITTDEPTAKLIGKLLRAKFPLKSVVGKTVTSVEMFEQPEPKQEPVKLYCVKDFSGRFTKGNIYIIGADGYLENYDNGVMGGTAYKSFGEYKSEWPNLAACLVPLVSRPAKVGEWVYIADATPICGQAYKNGDVFKITHMHKTFSYLACNDQQGDWFEDDEYLVLDGYKPEPDKVEPEYLNMRVVCVANGYCDGVAVGKVYTVKDGKLKQDNGIIAPISTSPFESLEDLNAKTAVRSGSKWIEFKGE